MIHVEAVVGAGLIATKIVAVVATAVAAIEETVAVTTIAIADHRDMKIETTAHTDVVTIMGPAGSIATPRAAVMTVTAAAVGTSVVAVEAMIGNVLAMVAMATPRLLGMLAMRMEVDPPTVSTIGTPVVKLRSAKIHRCVALSEIGAARPTSTSRARKTSESLACHEL